MANADGAEKRRLRNEWDELFKVVHSEKLGEIAAEFDRIHTVHRALKVGALDKILPPSELRPFLISAVDLGIKGERQAQSKLVEPKLAAGASA
jgi:hypothetical protein